MDKEKKNHYKVMVCQKTVGYVEVIAEDENEAFDLAQEEGEIIVVNESNEYGWEGGDGPGVRLIDPDGTIKSEQWTTIKEYNEMIRKSKSTEKEVKFGTKQLNYIKNSIIDFYGIDNEFLGLGFDLEDFIDSLPTY